MAHPDDPSEEIQQLPPEIARCALALQEMAEALAGSKEWSYLGNSKWLKVPNFVGFRIVPTKKRFVVSVAGPERMLRKSPAPELSLKPNQLHHYLGFTVDNPAQMVDAVVYVCRSFQHKKSKL